jgi:adenylate cyclase
MTRDNLRSHKVAGVREAIEARGASLVCLPFHPPTRLLYLGHADYMLGRYVDSVRTLRECASRLPNMQIVHLWLAAANSQSGQIAEARAAAAKVLQINPSFALEKWKCLNVYKNAKDSEQFLGELRKAGLP